MRRFDAVLSLAVLVLFSQRAPADVIDYQQFIQSHSALIHRYSFDGDSAERLEDQQGSADLTEKTRGTSPESISFTPGFAPPGSTRTSDAVVTTRDLNQDHNGAGLSTADGQATDYVSLPSTLTVEALFRPDRTSIASGSQEPLGFIVSFRPTADNRGYFVMQETIGLTSRLLTNIGDAFGAGNQVDLADPMIAGNWYYTATTYDVDENDGSTTITAYIADLTGGDTTLTALGPKTVPGSYFGAAPLTIGMRSAKAHSVDDDYFSFFPGAIDEVALYGTVLDQATLQSHLDAILVPEPSAFALLAIGLLSIMGFRRRRAR